VLVRVHGIGVLIEGAAGSGKSALALALLDRGHILVADDAVELRGSRGRLTGHCPNPLQGLLEVRGLGIVDARRLFGRAQFRRATPIGLVAILRRSPARVLRDLMPSVTRRGVRLPAVYLGAGVGHNPAVILETACRLLRPRRA